ncbi:MAG: DUF2813 domain-containing protein [Oxalobacteraceae bacterium]|nr:MAG: DUF2813 domain-containing protein [Oxalobacteraceae bacterium]
MKKQDDEVVTTGLERGRLTALGVSNFRCIGEAGVTIELDDIVVLVGPNNSGKSSLLRAYELVMNEGSKTGHVKVDDFPDSKVNPDKPIEIVLVTEVISGDPGKQWIGQKDGQIRVAGEDRKFVRERWTWSAVGAGKRSGWNVDTQSWDEKKPWGFAAVANSRRPAAHPVRAFDPPEVQGKQIHDLLRTVLLAAAKTLTNEKGENIYDKLLADLAEFQKLALEGSADHIASVEAGLNAIVSEIFFDHVVTYDQPAEVGDTSLSLFQGQGRILMGHRDGHRTALEHQGSGARRTMLWATLKYLCETKVANDKANVLLIDEPELCLHPAAVRDACRVLYDLASKDGWQVMLTTHSPVFIDLDRDNTTVVRVERHANGTIGGTTLFRPENAALSPDDRENLKLLNLYDPYVAEFFFGGRIVVVEGDTEYAAFRLVAQRYPEYRDVHVIRARGKATIASLAKVLNHFGSRYAILHDTDIPKVMTKGRGGKPPKEITNPAWTNNWKICEVVASAPNPERVRLVASKINFEAAYFETQLSSEKPYSAVEAMLGDVALLDRIRDLLAALLDSSVAVPEGAIVWEKRADLEAYIA